MQSGKVRPSSSYLETAAAVLIYGRSQDEDVIPVPHDFRRVTRQEFLPVYVGVYDAEGGMLPGLWIVKEKTFTIYGEEHSSVRHFANGRNFLPVSVLARRYPLCQGIVNIESAAVGGYPNQAVFGGVESVHDILRETVLMVEGTDGSLPQVEYPVTDRPGP